MTKVTFLTVFTIVGFCLFCSSLVSDSALQHVLQAFI